MRVVKKAAALLLCLTLCFGVFGTIPVKAAEPAVTFSLPDIEATAGEEILVPLLYSVNQNFQGDPKNGGFGGVAVEISYDNTVVEPIYQEKISDCCCNCSVKYVDLCLVNILPGESNDRSILSFGIAFEPNLTGSGTLIAFKFKVLENAAGGNMALTLKLRGDAENLTNGKTAIPGSFQNGSVTVRDLEVRNGSNAIVSTLPTGNFTVTVPALGSTVILACCGEGGQLLGTQIQTVNSDHKAQFSVENKNGSVKSIRVITLSSSWLPVQNMRSMSAA